MTTLSIPVDNTLMQFITNMIDTHKADSKAEVVRRALHQMREEEALKDVVEARTDIAQGKLYKGSLRELSNAI